MLATVTLCHKRWFRAWAELLVKHWQYCCMDSTLRGFSVRGLVAAWTLRTLQMVILCTQHHIMWPITAIKSVNYSSKQGAG